MRLRGYLELRPKLMYILPYPYNVISPIYPEALFHFIWGFPKLGVPPFGGPQNRDCSILGFIFGSRCFGKLPFRGAILQIGHVHVLARG